MILVQASNVLHINMHITFNVQNKAVVWVLSAHFSRGLELVARILSGACHETVQVPLGQFIQLFEVKYIIDRLHSHPLCQKAFFLSLLPLTFVYLRSRTE